MQLKRTLIALAIITIVLSGLGGEAHATKDIYIPPYKLDFYPTTELKVGVPISIKVELIPDEGWGQKDSGSVSVVVRPFNDRSKTVYETSWDVMYDDHHGLVTEFHLPVIPVDEVMEIVINIEWTGAGDLNYRYLEVKDGELEFFANYMPPSVPEYHELKRDTLTQQHLNSECVISVYLDSPEKKAIAERILGSIADSCLIEKYSSRYHIKTRLGKVFELFDENIGFEYAVPPPWSRQYYEEKYKLQREGSRLQPQKDTIEDTESSFSGESELILGDITMDSIFGGSTQGILPTGHPITFYIRLDNSTGSRFMGITNGFRVYSDEGAIEYY